MKSKHRYRKGQRWAFKPAVDGFETTLVIGAVSEAHPEFGINERKYDVYVQYAAAARELIPANWDGVILCLTDEGLALSVTKLVASNVKLPWWWVHGRRFKSKKDGPTGTSRLLCQKISDGLQHIFEGAKGALANTRVLEEALQEHREKFALKTKPKPSRSVAESWQRIESWFAENAFPLNNALGSGASAKEIQQFQKAIGAKLPKDFTESVRIHDGGGWWVPWQYGELLSLNQILEQWKMYCDWQASGEYATGGEDWKADDIKGPIKPVFWNKKRIYVTDNSGDHLTLDLDPPPEGIYGQVLDHSHEVGPMEVLASGWGVFLRNLVEDLESGKYLIAGAGGLELVDDLERRLNTQ
ncbi:MAG TPA: SMI1/KNR4 family protein [Gemmataceae bacterium]|nr:SMI1/KNR4 family protein [Gemmataceae bacterium]